MIRLAQKAAKRSDYKWQHGAVVTKGKRVLGIGTNSTKTHPTWGVGRYSAIHAEAAAIRDAVRQNHTLLGATIYVARVGSCSQMSRPCNGCLKLIQEHGISRIVYTDEDGEVVSEWPPPSKGHADTPEPQDVVPVSSLFGASEVSKSPRGRKAKTAFLVSST